jgi:hypothetical protein
VRREQQQLLVRLQEQRQRKLRLASVLKQLEQRQARLQFFLEPELVQLLPELVRRDFRESRLCFAPAR